MKGTKLIRMLRLTTVLILLIALLAGCGKNEAEETLNNLDNLDPTGTSESTEPPADTAEPTDPTEAPVETEPEETVLMGTVNTDLLNVRTGPSSSAAIAGQLTRNARIQILEQTTVDGVAWARTEVGWVCLDFIKVDNAETTTPEDPAEPTEAPESSTIGTKGTITADSLYIRKGPGTTYVSVGKYSKGDTVTVLETKDNWGRTDKGWISLKYVKLEGSNNNNKTENTDNKESTTLVTDGKTSVLGYVVIDVDALNVRYGPGTKYDVAGKVYEDARYAYYQEKNGWVRIKDGWISLAYTDKGEADKNDDKPAQAIVSDGKTTVLGYGVVKSGLNVRYGPGTNHDVADTVSTGERVAFYQKDGKWIRTKDGWVSLNYVYVEGEKGENGCSGTVTGDSVNVRQGPGTGYSSIKKLNKEDKVTILEQITVGKTTWGYTGEGWISMDYVKKA